MNDRTFASVLDRPVDQVEPPKAMPAGHYVALAPTQCKHGESSKKKTPFVEWELRVIQPMEDVDSEQLAAVGGAASLKPRLTFYVTEDAGYRLREFMVNSCGIDEADDDGEARSMRAMLPEVTGKQFIIGVTHDIQTERNGQPLEVPLIRAQITSTAAV